VGIAERMYDLVKGLPEKAAEDVLDYAQAKCAKSPAASALAARRASALAVLDKHARRLTAVKLDRATLPDRAGLR